MESAYPFIQTFQLKSKEVGLASRMLNRDSNVFKWHKRCSFWPGFVSTPEGKHISLNLLWMHQGGWIPMKILYVRQGEVQRKMIDARTLLSTFK